MTIVILTALVAAAATISARVAASRRVATAEVPVLTKTGERELRRQRRNA